MTKDEVLSLGVPEDKYRAFQMAYQRDLNKLAKRQRAAEDADQLTRSAIHAMLELIKRPETLDRILQYINKAYYMEV